MKQDRKIYNNLSGLPSIDNPHLVNYPQNARKQIYSGIKMRMYDFMYDRISNNQDLIAMEYFGTKITYRAMLEQIKKYAQVLSKFGIQKGDFISICLPNIPEVVYLKYAINRVGAVFNMIDPRTNPNGILERTNLSKSKLLFTVIDICKDKIDLIKNNLNVENIIIISPAYSLSKKLIEQTNKTLPINVLYSLKEFLLQQTKTFNRDSIYKNIDDFLSQYANDTNNFDALYEENMPVAALYTSGTTADSIDAGVFSNENYNSMVKNMSYGSDYIKPGKRFLGAIPFFSAYGSFCGFHHSFSNAWNVIMVPRFKPIDYAKLIINTKSNAALGVPKFWEQFISINNQKKDILEQLEIPVTGGDWISIASIEKINRKFFDYGCKTNLKIGYGATEFGGVVSTTLDDENKYNEYSVGTLLPGNKAMIINPETNEELGYNVEGELCISGPTMMLEYLNNKSKTEQITIYKNGEKYYKTGDKMMINEYGDLMFCDRYKRVMMRPDGHTVACAPIENIISSHQLVKGCAVVGIKLEDGSSGTIPTAFVVLHNPKLQTRAFANELDNYCLDKIGERERALAINFVDKIPYTLNGKIDFRNLAKQSFSEMTNLYIMDYTFFEKQKEKTYKKH